MKEDLPITVKCEHKCLRCGKNWSHDSNGPGTCALPEVCLCDMCFYGKKRMAKMRMQQHE